MTSPRTWISTIVSRWGDSYGTARGLGGSHRRSLRLETLESRIVYANLHPAGAVPAHSHTHLSIYLDGQNFGIPASVGHSVPGPIIGTFNEDAHTHTDDGVVHFNEGSPAFRNLKEFFDTWGAEFDQNHIRLPNDGGGFTTRTVDASHALRFLVNGSPSPFYELYEPEDGDQILISYEPIPGPNIPQLRQPNNITFSSNTLASAPVRIFSQPLDASDPNGSPLTFSATSSLSGVTAQISPPTNRSLRLNVSGKDIEGNDFTGDIVIQLYEDLAPETTSRIIQLANQGFYSNTTLHRVLLSFVAQGGDPDGDGTGGSGVDFSDEFDPTLTFNGFGQFAMANSGDDTNDSQFFLTDSRLSLLTGIDSQRANPPRSLNFNHTIFGQMTSGFDTFNKVMLTPVNANPNSGEPSSPATTVRVHSAQVFTDNQRAVLRLSAAPNSSGVSTINVRATNANGVSTEREFLARIIADTFDDRAFLGDVGDIQTALNTPITIDLPGTDLEGADLTFVIRDVNNFQDGPANVAINIDQALKKATLTPANGFQGTIRMLVGVRDQTSRGSGLDARTSFDTEEIALTVGGGQFSWTNPNNQYDVNNQDGIQPLDALLIINELTNRAFSNPMTGVLPAPTSQPTRFFDVNRDNVVSATDALQVINRIPASRSALASQAVTSDLDAMASDARKTAAVEAVFSQDNFSTLGNLSQRTDFQKKNLRNRPSQLARP
jgi:cyclophilin family peptidyl-prolyl cis-trans isomerase